MNRTIKLTLIILALLALFSSYPYVFECLIPIPPLQITGAIFIAVFSIIAISDTRRGASLPVVFWVICFIQGFVWLFYAILHSDTSYISRLFFIVYSCVLITALFKKDALYSFGKVLNYWLAIQGVLGCIAFILFFNGLLSSAVDFEIQGTGRPAAFYYITCSNMTIGNVMRVAGFFDEPGALAFWGVYSLVYNKLFYNDKRIEYILLFTLLFTLSAAYFVQLVLYVLFFYTGQIKKNFIFLIIAVGLVFFALNFVSQNEFLSELTTERFQGGEIRSGRYDLSEMAKEQFYNNPVFGNGAKRIDEIAYMGDNPYEILAKDGIVGLIVVYLPLFALALRFHNKKLLLGILIIAAGYLQRPFHVNLMHSVYLYSFFILSYLSYEQPKKHANAFSTNNNCNYLL